MNPIKQAILNMVDCNSPYSSQSFDFEIYSVVDVDVEKRSCTLSDINGNLFRNIRVQFIGASTFLLPAVDSIVIAFISRALSAGYILMTSVIEAAEVVIGDNSAIIDAKGLRIKTANMSADFNADNIILNGGDLNGLVIIQKLTDKLNELVQAFNSHTHTGTHGPTSAPLSQAAEFNKSDYENEKIKQ